MSGGGKRGERRDDSFRSRTFFFFLFQLTPFFLSFFLLPFLLPLFQQQPVKAKSAKKSKGNSEAGAAEAAAPKVRCGAER